MKLKLDHDAESILAQLWQAFPSTPYPGDHILTDCYCEECSHSIRSLRGKSWKEVKLEDLNSDSSQLGDDAFRYYLPALLSISLQHPDDDMIPARVSGRLVVFDTDPRAKDHSSRITSLVAQITKRQRNVVAVYLDWVAQRELQSPVLIEAGKKALESGVVDPCSIDAHLRWCRELESKLKSKA